jgi:ELWxxDGT repeat protein
LPPPGELWQSDGTAAGTRRIEGFCQNGCTAAPVVLTDVEYTLTVTDTASGAVRAYHNPRGRLCGGADTGAFLGGS